MLHFPYLKIRLVVLSLYQNVSFASTQQITRFPVITAFGRLFCHSAFIHYFDITNRVSTGLPKSLYAHESYFILYWFDRFGIYAGDDCANLTEPIAS